MDDTLLPVATSARRPAAPLSSVPPLYIITPTYRRPEQIPELTRLAQTLMHIPNLHWLVIEDSVNKTLLVTQLLFRTGIPFDHLIGKCFIFVYFQLNNLFPIYVLLATTYKSKLFYPLSFMCLVLG